MSKNQTESKPADAEQPADEGLDGTPCSLLVSDLIAELRSQAEDMRCQQNLGSYADRTEDAADTLEKYVKAMDAIYNHNAAARAAVIQHFGLWHHTANLTLTVRRHHDQFHHRSKRCAWRRYGPACCWVSFALKINRKKDDDLLLTYPKRLGYISTR